MLEVRGYINNLKNEISGEELSSATREKKYNIHRRFIQWLIDTEMTEDKILNKVNSIVREKGNAQHGDYLTKEEFNQYISTEKDQLVRLIFGFLFCTGQRISRVLGIQWKDIQDVESANGNRLIITLNKSFTRRNGLVATAKNGTEIEMTEVSGDLRQSILEFKNQLQHLKGEVHDEDFVFSYDGKIEKKIFKKIENAHIKLKKMYLTNPN